MNVIADLRQHFSVNALHGHAAVADQAVFFLQNDRPQAETVVLVVFQIPLEPLPHLFFIKGRGIVLHGFRIRKDRIPCREIVVCQFP